MIEENEKNIQTIFKKRKIAEEIQKTGQNPCDICFKYSNSSNNLKNHKKYIHRI